MLGPRQAGKSTLAHAIARARKAKATFLDLERPSDLERLSIAPEQDLDTLQRQLGLICIDEVQRLPSLYPLLRVLLDDPHRRARYVLLGSASPDLVAGVSETLAGRLALVDLTPFLAVEVRAREPADMQRLWLRGGFPRSFLARSNAASLAWRQDYIRTFLERDIPALGLRLPAAALRRFWTMLAHLHGGILNASEIGAGMGVSPPTVVRWLDVLEGAFLVKRLAPWWANVGKRLTKSPKVYIRDTGILHALLDIGDVGTLRSHPKVGLSWEGWVIEQVVGALRLLGESAEPYYWRTHGGAEVDLLLRLRGRLVPIEIKLSGEARPSRGLIECMRDLQLTAGFVIHGGRDAYAMGNGLRALPTAMVARPNDLLAELIERD